MGPSKWRVRFKSLKNPVLGVVLTLSGIIAALGAGFLVVWIVVVVAG